MTLAVWLLDGDQIMDWYLEGFWGRWNQVAKMAVPGFWLR